MAEETDRRGSPAPEGGPQPPPAGPQKNQWWLVIAAGLAVFMASVDMSIVNVALPAIERDLKIDTSMTEWVVLGYLLPLAGLALPSGRWLDTVGRRPALIFSLTGFALASVAAGLSTSLTWLIAARLLQGTFGALLFSLVPALATTAVKPQARGRAMGLITTLGPLGLISGPGLGGLIVDGLGWTWIFFVNVPVSVLVMIVGVRTLAPGKPLHLPDRAWFAEAALLSTAVAALLLSLSFTASEGPVWLLLALVAVPLLVAWLRMPLSRAVRGLFQAPGEVGPHVALLASATAIGTVFFITPFFMERELDVSVSAVGATVLLFPLGMALTGPVGGVLGDLWGARRTALLGTVLFTVGLALLLPMDSSWGAGDLAWRLFVAGCGNGLFNAPNAAMAMGNAPQPLLATTGSSTNLARTLGFAFGPALATVMWAASDYDRTGMQWAMTLATILSALAVVALLRTADPGKKRESAPAQPATGSTVSR
ncbi:MFS transporter [Actinoplanes xinjiangensis]|uniref:MFS transporter n=1 Tax=Actinoplanes xinjiangensis TaxID=512350 RepID=A0A316FEI4_9ACTN|nr:MFS transporter [Actinoplanes xinjiangensis]PWK36040.1 MFS transporter [Actinoplanes xinjiangensis]GIF42961.1 MFS transporter [Actinoplanes xinjiangensis]